MGWVYLGQDKVAGAVGMCRSSLGDAEVVRDNRGEAGGLLRRWLCPEEGKQGTRGRGGAVWGRALDAEV